MTKRQRLHEDDPYYPEDLERATGLSRDVVRAAILAGELPGYKVGNQYRIPAKAFRDFCAGLWVPQPRRVLRQPATRKPVPSDFVHTKPA
jgi:excisionase family DNA binding protein